MTTSKSNTVSLSAKEWVSGDRDLMKSLMKEALQEVLEAEMTEFLGAAPSERSETRSGYRAGYYCFKMFEPVARVEVSQLFRDRCLLSWPGPSNLPLDPHRQRADADEGDAHEDQRDRPAERVHEVPGGEVADETEHREHRGQE